MENNLIIFEEGKNGRYNIIVDIAMCFTFVGGI